MSQEETNRPVRRSLLQGEGLLTGRQQRPLREVIVGPDLACLSSPQKTLKIIQRKKKEKCLREDGSERPSSPEPSSLVFGHKVAQPFQDQDADYYSSFSTARVAFLPFPTKCPCPHKDVCVQWVGGDA